MLLVAVGGVGHGHYSVSNNTCRNIVLVENMSITLFGGQRQAELFTSLSCQPAS